MIGAVINNYRVEELLGEGGMGNVYLAVHEQLGRKVAIKALHSFLAKNEEIKIRFKNEAAALSQLQHPNIVSLYDYIEYNEGAFLVMEYVEGITLDKYIQTVTGPIPEERAVNIFLKILEGVEFAHSKNIIHRDIKPSNIIITADENIKILDFGIAKIIDEPSHKLTKTGTKVGTVYYMSPEQVRGKELSITTDIYSLGITFFEMLTGKCPYAGIDSEYEVYTKIVNEELPSPTTFYPAVSLELEMILRKASQKDQALRYANCDTFRQSVLERNQKKPFRLKIKIPNKKVIISLAIIIILAIIGIGVKLLFSGQKSQMYVLSYTLSVRKAPNENAQKLKSLKFGDALTLLGSKIYNDKSKLKWVEVKTNGVRGYVVINFLGEKEELDIINQLFGQYNVHWTIAVAHKKALAGYFLENSMLKGDSQKVSYALPILRKANDPTPFSVGDYNNDGIADFACFLENRVDSSAQKKWKLLVFLSSGSDKFYCALNEDFSKSFKIRNIPKGKESGGWYIGNKIEKKTEWGGKYKEDRYENLSHDGLMIIYNKNNEVSIYYFNLLENQFKAYKQKR